MKQTYEKPFSTVVQMATESIIAASDISAIISSDLNMEVVDGTVEFGGWE